MWYMTIYGYFFVWYLCYYWKWTTPNWAWLDPCKVVVVYMLDWKKNRRLRGKRSLGVWINRIVTILDFFILKKSIFHIINLLVVELVCVVAGSTKKWQGKPDNKYHYCHRKSSSVYTKWISKKCYYYYSFSSARA